MIRGLCQRVCPDVIREAGMTDNEADILSKHAQRRRDVLARAVTVAPVVSLLLTQASRPARATPIYATTAPAQPA
jgi:hypothetical protein